MATKGKRHVHKYHKVSLSYADVWACALPDCPHHMPPHMENMVEGRYSFCWQCDERFILDSMAMRERQPRCPECRVGGISKLLELTKTQ